jgi:hypothetical protein
MLCPAQGQAHFTAISEKAAMWAFCRLAGTVSNF